jgi:hypothetical protein
MPLPICANVRITHSRSLHIPPPHIIIFGDAQIGQSHPQIGDRGGWRPYSPRGFGRGDTGGESPQWGVCARG